MSLPGAQQTIRVKDIDSFPVSVDISRWKLGHGMSLTSPKTQKNVTVGLDFDSQMDLYFKKRDFLTDGTYLIQYQYQGLILKQSTDWTTEWT